MGRYAIAPKRRTRTWYLSSTDALLDTFFPFAPVTYAKSHVFEFWFVTISTYDLFVGPNDCASPGISKSGSGSSSKQLIKRPQNAFFMFMADLRKNPDFESLSQQGLSKEAGARWRVLSTQERARYKELSNMAWQDHAKEHPEYTYQKVKPTPTKKRRRKPRPQHLVPENFELETEQPSPSISNGPAIKEKRHETPREMAQNMAGMLHTFAYSRQSLPPRSLSPPQQYAATPTMLPTFAHPQSLPSENLSPAQSYAATSASGDFGFMMRFPCYFCLIVNRKLFEIRTRLPPPPMIMPICCSRTHLPLKIFPRMWTCPAQ